MIKKQKRSKLFVRFVGLTLLAALLTFTLTAYATDSQESSQTDDGIIKTVDDLPGKTIGVQLGTTGDTYATDYEGDEAGTKIERYNKAADAVQALKQKKIDCVIIDDQPANEFLKKNSDIKKLDENFSNEDYAFCVKKGRTELLDKINASLDKLKKDGTLANIITNYIGTDEQKGTMPYEKKDVDRSNGKIVVATNAEFKPYEYYENGVVTGIDMDIMQAICDDLGMEMQIEDMQFDSIIVAVQSGKADVGAAGMTITEDRKKNVDFSDSYTNAKQVILVRNTDNNSGSADTKADNNIIKTVDDLPGKTIGVQLGTTGDTYATDYEGDEAGTKIERYN
ncbi:MAG: transporter substrate-binding domain-containing protein, partial [Acutalibacteraceae bacterium]